jgi:NAD(P)-dependent dehydrogenase (short-subunit alcohol dehydrogenase family)
MSVAVVTGASRGVGREIARQLADLGYTVVAGARNAGDVDVPGVHAVQLDVTSDASVAAAVATVHEEFGGATVLVNNAGLTYADAPDALDPAIDLEIARGVMDVNLYGAWRVARAFVPQLRAAERARLVNVSSSFGQMAHPAAKGGPYKVTKAALNMLTTIMAEELRDDGVLVNAICPGAVANLMPDPWGAWSQADLDSGPALRPIEVAAASAVWAVTIPDDGPTGGFFQDGRPIDW